MPHYLCIYREPSLSQEEITAQWMSLATERRAIWVKTWHNVPSRRRFSWWDSPSRDNVEEIFRDHGIPLEEIIEVELTTPADWRWRED